MSYENEQSNRALGLIVLGLAIAVIIGAVKGAVWLWHHFSPIAP